LLFRPNINHETVKGEIEFGEGRRVERQLGHRTC